MNKLDKVVGQIREPQNFNFEIHMFMGAVQCLPWDTKSAEGKWE